MLCDAPGSCLKWHLERKYKPDVLVRKNSFVCFGRMRRPILTLPAEQIARHPNIVPSLRFLAKTLRERFDNGPRLARLLASHQRWLLTQVAYALHHERDPAQPFSGLTTV